MKRQIRSGYAALALLVFVAACAKPETINASTVADNSGVAALNIDEVNTAGIEATPVAIPEHHYQDREGDRYLYVGAVSEDDRKDGKVVGNVVEYRFLGERDGKLTLQEVSEEGFVKSMLECSRDCRIMKLETYGGATRIPYDPSSIGGAAMEDALNGFLIPVKLVPQPAAVPLSPPSDAQPPAQDSQQQNNSAYDPDPSRSSF